MYNSQLLQAEKLRCTSIILSDDVSVTENDFLWDVMCIMLQCPLFTIMHALVCHHHLVSMETLAHSHRVPSR